MWPVLLLGGALYLLTRSDEEPAPDYYPAPTPAPYAPPPPTVPAPGPGAPPPVTDVQRLDAAAHLARMVAQDVKTRGEAYDKALLRRFQATAAIGIDGKYGPESAGAVAWYIKPEAPPPPFPRYGKGLRTYFPRFGQAMKASPAPAPVRSTGPAPAPAPAPIPVPMPPPVPVAPPKQPAKKPPVRAKPKAAPKAKATAPSPAPVSPPVPAVPQASPPQVKDIQRLDAAAVLAHAVAADIKAKREGHDKALLKRFQQTAGLKADGLYGAQSAGAVAWYIKPEPAPEPLPRYGKGFATYVPKF